MKKQADKIKRVGLIGNSEKAACADIVRKATRLISRAGRKVAMNPDTAALAREVDLLLVFGGDGTMLRAARDIAGSATPLLGINIGGLGFLTAVPSNELPRALHHIWHGEFKYESRALIEASGRFQGRPFRGMALNDIIVGRGAVSRLIDLDVSVDGELVTHYRCDGLIVSSPTGSTAYSLSAGGAVVFPTADVFALTPICPHALSNRPLIFPLSSVIRVKPTNPSPATLLSMDGQVVAELDAGDEVTIRRSRRAIRLMHLADSSFLETLRRKLQWRGAYV
ncbi:MAG TPA: NAD(+)/NADH kinase [Candidatus Acidoferrales bacterium]|nr:NAD(+)/NADH kinase [Candidatus Acidoferrales bacterium]